MERVGREAKRWRDNLAMVLLTVQQNNSGRFVNMEVTPESPKRSEVLFFIPAEVQGSGWLALAEACARLFRVEMRESRAGIHGRSVVNS